MRDIISGTVVRGKKKGGKLGFPTVNILPDKKIGSGVYEGKVIVNSKKYKAGIFVGPDDKLLEAHIVGFGGNLYGKEIEVEVGTKIREVMNFNSDEDLKKQIKEDIEKICSRGL